MIRTQTISMKDITTVLLAQYHKPRVSCNTASNGWLQPRMRLYQPHVFYLSRSTHIFLCAVTNQTAHISSSSRIAAVRAPQCRRSARQHCQQRLKRSVQQYVMAALRACLLQPLYNNARPCMVRIGSKTASHAHPPAHAVGTEH